MKKDIKVGITMGDPNGVGPEITVRALADETMLDLCTPVIFADMKVLEEALRVAAVELPRLHVVKNAADARLHMTNVVDLAIRGLKVMPGQPTAESGAAAVEALEQAMSAIATGDIDLLVTAPISKEAVQSDKFHFPGHTEYLNAKAGDQYKSMMILFDDDMRVALLTTHLPISEIPGAITKERIVDYIERYSQILKSDFSIAGPKIAVLSLNPHCGDGGLLGNEEKDVIMPAIEEALGKGLLAFGPYAADGFFGSEAYRKFDGILAMYHDQGLAPFKTMAKRSGVNFTGGLPFVRTSPDHGTAYDIAWKGTADAASMREAIYKAIDIYRNRLRYEEMSVDPLKKAPAENRKKKTETDKE